MPCCASLNGNPQPGGFLCTWQLNEGVHQKEVPLQIILGFHVKLLGSAYGEPTSGSPLVSLEKRQTHFWFATQMVFQKGNKSPGTQAVSHFWTGGVGQNTTSPALILGPPSSTDAHHSTTEDLSARTQQLPASGWATKKSFWWTNQQRAF